MRYLPKKGTVTMIPGVCEAHQRERDFKGKGLKEVEALAGHIICFSRAGICEISHSIEGTRS